jgi:uncharacterized protein (TIGR02246 family)
MTRRRPPRRPRDAGSLAPRPNVSLLLPSDLRKRLRRNGYTSLAAELGVRPMTNSDAAYDHDDLAIRKLEGDYDAAWNRGDVSSLVALYLPDAVVINPRGEITRGHTAIRAALQAFVHGPTRAVAPRRRTHRTAITAGVNRAPRRASAGYGVAPHNEDQADERAMDCSLRESF